MMHRGLASCNGCARGASQVTSPDSLTAGAACSCVTGRRCLGSGADQPQLVRLAQQQFPVRSKRTLEEGHHRLDARKVLEVAMHADPHGAAHVDLILQKRDEVGPLLQAEAWQEHKTRS